MMYSLSLDKPRRKPETTEQKIFFHVYENLKATKRDKIKLSHTTTYFSTSQNI